MDIERRTPANTAIVLVDYVTGFANMLGSQSVTDNVIGAVAIAKIALGFDVPMVVTLGPRNDPRGGLYPELSALLGDHPLVYRGGNFDSFDTPEFEEAVAQTGRRHLVIAGIATDGCVLHTTLGALRRDYAASIVVDATASLTQDGHDSALLRLINYGVTPVTYMSLASELQRSYANADTLDAYLDVQAQQPKFRMLRATIAASATNGAASFVVQSPQTSARLS